MNTKVASRGLMSKFQRTLLAVLVVMILFSSLPAGKAHAWGTVNRWGTPPPVTPNTIYLSAAGNSAGQFVISVSGRGPTMPSNNINWGNHYVSVQYQLEKLVRDPNGSSVWSTIAATAYTDFISLGTGTTVFLRDVNFQLSGTGYFRVTYKIFWYYSSTRIIAYTEIVPTLAGDFSCTFGLAYMGLPCHTGSGWFKIGY